MVPVALVPHETDILLASVIPSNRSVTKITDKRIRSTVTLSQYLTMLWSYYSEAVDLYLVVTMS